MAGLGRYPALFLLWIFQGVIAFVWLFVIPSDGGMYSLARLGLLGLVFLLTTISGIFFYKAWFGSSTDFAIPPAFQRSFYFGAWFFAIFSPLVIIVLSALGHVNYLYQAYAARLTPLAFFVSLSSLEWCFWQIKDGKADFSSDRQVIKPFLFFMLVGVGLWLVMQATGWGITAIRDGSFGSYPTPFVEWQFILAIFSGVASSFLLLRWHLSRKDVFFSLLVYLLACVVWLGTPLIPGFFATAPRAPNFEHYPFSDALIYAQYAQSALVGQGFLWPDVPTRPFYVALLTWMHALVGQNYDHVIVLQTVLLAFFPVGLYWLGRELGSRALGVVLSILVILRDITTNYAAPFASNYSYSKLFFSEIPTALVLVFFTIMAMRWLKSARPDWFLLAMGGVLGLASLIRLQSMVLWGVLAVVAFFSMWTVRRMEWLRGMTLILLGLILMLAPWLVRNYVASDGFVLDNPISQSMTMARRWSGWEDSPVFHQQPNETAAQFTSRMTSIAMESFAQDPGRILNSAANHFFNNLIADLYILPVRDGLRSFGELIWPEHAFWQTGQKFGILSLFYLSLFSLGLGFAWASARWIGLLPFIFSLGYHAWTALFLSSGDRFLIPIDWTWLVYYAWAALVLVRWMFNGLQIPMPFLDMQGSSALPQPRDAGRRATVFAVIMIIAVGMSLPLTEFMFPQKYPAVSPAEMSIVLGEYPNPGEVIVYGRAVYPRYYEAEDGEPGSAKLGYAVSNQARLVFWLVGSRPGLVIFPLQHAPEFFPHASDVWIIGTQDGDALLARVIKVDTVILQNP